MAEREDVALDHGADRGQEVHRDGQCDEALRERMLVT